MMPASADAIVIGGGVMGCSVAYYLAKRGLKPVVLERGELNEQSSGSNAGSLHVQMLAQFARFDDPAIMAAVERTLALHAAGVEEWRSLAGELAEPIEIQVNGGITVASDEADYRFLSEKVARETRAGITVHLLDAGEARTIAPYLSPGIAGAAYCPNEGRLNPALATTVIARAAEKRGATFLRHTPLRGLKRAGSRLVAQTPAGEVTSDVVVNAAGPWADEVAAMMNVSIPMDRGVLQMNVSEVAPPFLPHLIQHASRRLTMKQATNGNVLVGGGWPGRLDDRGRPEVLRKSIAGNLTVACGVIPQLAGLNLIRTWASIVSRVPDYNPVLGALDSVPGFYQALAIPNGFTLGPICARLLVADIFGEPPEWDMAPFSPKRFN